MKKVHWINIFPYPLYAGITDCPEAFKREMKRLGIKEDVAFVNTDASATTHFFTSKKHTNTAIICVDTKCPKRASPTQMMALIVHEAVHIWQECKEMMRETKPGNEIEAYAIQWISQCCFDALMGRRKK